MKQQITLAIVTTFLMLTACKKETSTDISTTEGTTEKTYSNIEKANWFLGEWANTSNEGELTERWKKENDSVFHGESYFVKENKDTVFAEHVKLWEANGKLTYTVTVPNQNNGEAVDFEMTSSTTNQIVFENPKHDFPNKITYNKVGNDSLVAEISGIQKGKPASEKFAMKKR
ncbi:DUF6265 family protein [Flavobacterium suzhouense]|uniref:DUF6265 family protein n=1 Tax=Flavobacterium suzhouense TaxID=1529638 RepID=A0ABW5NT96_9FLAO